MIFKTWGDRHRHCGIRPKSYGEMYDYMQWSKRYYCSVCGVGTGLYGSRVVARLEWEKLVKE